MNKITQTILFRQSPINYSQKFSVIKAAIKYNTNRQYIYRWLGRYDGTIQPLADRSHRPHSHPNQHKPEELKLIADMRRRNPEAGLVVFWVKLMQAMAIPSQGFTAYSRSRGRWPSNLRTPSISQNLMNELIYHHYYHNDNEL